MSVELKIGDFVVHHYCGGSTFGVVTKINLRTVRVVEDGDPDKGPPDYDDFYTFPKNKVSLSDRETQRRYRESITLTWRS